MGLSIRVQTTVLPGGRIEIRSPELPEGRTVTVQVDVAEPMPAKRTFRENLGGYAGARLFKTAEEVEAYLRAEREAWDD